MFYPSAWETDCAFTTIYDGTGAIFGDGCCHHYLGESSKIQNEYPGPFMVYADHIGNRMRKKKKEAQSAGRCT